MFIERMVCPSELFVGDRFNSDRGTLTVLALKPEDGVVRVLVQSADDELWLDFNPVRAIKVL